MTFQRGIQSKIQTGSSILIYIVPIWIPLMRKNIDNREDQINKPPTKGAVPDNLSMDD